MNAERFAWLCGELAHWPSKRKMVLLFEAAGVEIVEGRYSIRIKDCCHFVFQHYGGDICDPTIDADADSVEQLTVDGQRVSNVLAGAALRHRFEIYDDQNVMVEYLHYDWPLSPKG